MGIVQRALFRAYNGSPAALRSAARAIYRSCFERYLLRRNVRKLQRSLSLVIRSYSIGEREVYVELKNGLKFFGPRCKSPSMGNLSGLKGPMLDLISACPMFWETEEILFDKLYDRRTPLREGAVVVDAGANIGLFTIYAAKLVGNRGRVIALEPEAENMEYLRRNARLNRCRNIVFVRQGLADHNGTVELSLSESATHTMVSENLGGLSAGTVRIGVRTLPEVLRRVSAQKVDLVKMDIEGAEVQAIVGSAEYLRRHRVPLSVAAYHHYNGEVTYAQLVPVLESFGYTIDKAALPHIYAT